MLGANPNNNRLQNQQGPGEQEQQVGRQRDDLIAYAPIEMINTIKNSEIGRSDNIGSRGAVDKPPQQARSSVPLYINKYLKN